jgi:hypothetical protein
MRKFRVGVSPDIGPGQLEKFWLDQLGFVEEHSARKRMYGSSAAWCPRNNFLQSVGDFDGGNDVFPPTASMYMAIGNGLEQALVDGLYRNKLLLFNNLTMPKCDPNVGGKIDLVYINPDNEIAIAEVKSCGKLPLKSKPEHQAQLMVYSAIAGYSNCTLVYLSREVRGPTGNPLIKCFQMDTSEEAILAVLEKITFSQIAINENWIPPIPATFAKTTSCRYCQFNQFCWEPFGDEPKFPELTPEQLEDAHARSFEWAQRLYQERVKRHVLSLRHLFRNTSAKHLKPRIAKEIEKYEKF